MQIEQMSATFGRLNGSQLDLQPGLNVICAPNESGKSTWCRFLQNMLYGVPTKERGLLADKNRYAPWSGSPMQGRLLLRNGAHLCAAALWQIDGRVDKNADGFHRVSSCSAAHSRSRLPQINSSAAYILLRCSSVRPMLAASSIEAMRACRAAKTSRPRSVRYRGLR